MTDQVAFPFDADFPSKRNPFKPKERPEHEGLCELDLEHSGMERKADYVLRCALAAHHRVSLSPDTRQSVMKTLLAGGYLKGRAKDEAETWLRDETPYGFITKGG